MSRIGKRPVALPQGVKVSIKDRTVTVEGPKGKLLQDINDEVELDIRAADIEVTRKSDTRQARAFHGLYRNLLNNMVTGVSKGFSIGLLINGVGYRAEVRGEALVLNLGFSSEVFVGIPKGVAVVVEANNQKVVVSGIDRHLVGQFASEVRGLRPPEPYKGKGIRYETETIRKKVGKTGVK